MPTVNLIKLAAFQVVSTPEEEVVKLAGLFSNLKHWLRRKFTNPVFNQDVLQLLRKINWHTEQAEDAIHTKDVEAYQHHIRELKTACQSLLNHPDLLPSDKLPPPTEKISPSTEKTSPETVESEEPVPADVTPEGPSSYRQLADVTGVVDLSNVEVRIIFNKREIIREKIKSLIKINHPALDLIIVSLNDKGLFNSIISAIKKGIASDQPDGSIISTTAPIRLPGSNIAFTLKVQLVQKNKQLEVVDVLDIQPIKKANRTVQLLKLANQVSRKYTKLNDKQFADILLNGYQNAFGKLPSLPTLAAGWAQATLESGRNPIQLPCNNIGNIKAHDSKIPYFVMDTYEFDKTGKSYKEIGTKWRAFASPEEGATFYWKYLANNYGSAITQMEAGNSKAASEELGKHHYYTANIEKYSNATQAGYDQFMKTLASNYPQLDKGIHPVSTPSGKPANDTSVDTLTDQLFRAAGPVTKLIQKVAIRKLPETSLLVRAEKNSINYQGLQALGRLSVDLFSSCYQIKEAGDFLHLKIRCRGSLPKVEAAHQALTESLQVAKPAFRADIFSGLQ